MRARAIMFALALAIASALAGGSLQRLRAAGAAERAASETTWVRYVMVGLGGFRGVISEVLWLRADRLQEQGRYFELAQLAEWINALDPRAADAWAFSAWNLAYNIGAMTPDVESKLHWLHAGISLLRDKAIPANPTAPSLYRELGWLYQNKIGTADDPANVAYKLDLAADATRPSGERLHPLDPATMAEIESRFGAIDWRLPHAHAIHWAWRGLALNPTGFDRESLRRMVHQSLATLILSGKFTGDVEKGKWSVGPDWELVRPTMAFFEESMVESPFEGRIYRIFLEALGKRLESEGEDALAKEVERRLYELGGPIEEEP